MRVPTEVALATSPLAQALTFGTPEGTTLPGAGGRTARKAAIGYTRNRFGETRVE